MEERESQVMEVAFCDLPTAKRLLQQNGDDVQAAIMAFYSADAGQGQSVESNAIVPFQQDVQPAQSGWSDPPDNVIGPQPQGPNYEQNWGPYDANLGGRDNKTERTSKKRNTPVDLTGDDEDDDLRKAMQASLESESTRQKRQQDYGYDSRTGARAVSELNHTLHDSEDGQSEARCKGSRSEREGVEEQAEEEDSQYINKGSKSQFRFVRQKTFCRRGSKRRRFRLKPKKEVANHDMELDVDYKPTSEAHKMSSQQDMIEGEPNTSSGYNLRNRSSIQRPENLYDEICTRNRAISSSMPKPKPKPRKVNKTTQKKSWWETANAANDDDEALSRAIEASMQQSASATRPQSPQATSQILESLGAQRIRTPEQPVAIVPPTPFMRLFASAFQALYAAKPFRQALMSLKLSDLRLAASSLPSMEKYWQGDSPSSHTILSEETLRLGGITATEEEREAIDGTMRLLTLFVFLTFTKRPLCLADDLISHPPKSNYAYVMNSSRRPASDIVSCHVQATLEIILAAIDCLGKQGELDDCKKEMRNACLSFTATAVAPQSEESKNLRKPKDPYEITIHQLIHNNVNTSVHKALYAHLSEDKSLYTSTASTLFLSLGRLGVNSLSFGFGHGTDHMEDITPFEVESKLYLDQFMFEERNGVRLGLDSDKVKGHLARIEELEKYRKNVGWHKGVDSRVLLRKSLKYFEEVCKGQEGDQVRSDSISEAVPRLSKLLLALEQEIERVDNQLKDERTSVDEERKMTMTGFLEGLDNPRLQNLRYDLQAVSMNDEQTAWTYVRHDGLSRDSSGPVSSWWKICDGHQEQVSESDVLSDRNVVHFLIYTRHEEASQDEQQSSKEKEEVGTFIDEVGGSKPNKTIRLDTVLNWWTNTQLVECIEADNAMFGNQLAQTLKQTHDRELNTETTMADGREAQSAISVEDSNEDNMVQ